MMIATNGPPAREAVAGRPRAAAGALRCMPRRADSRGLTLQQAHTGRARSAEQRDAVPFCALRNGAGDHGS